MPPANLGPRRSCCVYRENDWNALHRDLYGDLVFPLQVVIGLDRPGLDHTGGEFLLLSNSGRGPSPGAPRPSCGTGHTRCKVFTTATAPSSPSAAGRTAPVRHGVSTVRSWRLGTPSAWSFTTPL
nr:2OG-Fe(II) oxygenase [Fodinicola feengrottensis]